MILNTILMVLFASSPLIIGDSTTLDSHIQTNTDDEALTDTTLSFGIKSFTFEVTKPTTKPLDTTSQSTLPAEANDKSTITNLDKFESTQQPNSYYLSTISTHATDQFHHTTDLQLQSSTETIPISATFMPFSTISSSASSSSSSQPINNNENHPTAFHSNITEMRTESEIEQESTDERPPAFSSNSPIFTTTTVNSTQSMTTTHEPMINDIHIEKKLENGLYRIKLAEIITDEFNGIGINNDDTASSIPVSHETNHHNFHQTSSKNAGKINIIDLYPSKLEDFGPIIRDSNKKMIHDKQAFLNDDDDENVLSNSLNDLFEADKNIPTSKIEIELIDGNESNQKSIENSEKITDLTGKLQEQDGVITEIEKKFRLDDLKSTSSSSHKDDVSQKSSSVNQKIEFIDRRVKKSFDFPQNQFGGRLSRIDFANTKFNTEPVKKDENSPHFREGDKPEFSTTKFYNSKELYNEMLHRKINSENIVKKLTTTFAPITITDEEKDKKMKKSEAKEPQGKKKLPSDSLFSSTVHKFSTKATNTNPTQKYKTTVYTTPRTIAQPKIITSLEPSLKTIKNTTPYSSLTSQEIIHTTTSSVSSPSSTPSQPPSLPVTSVETLGVNKESTNNGEQEMIQQNPKLKALKVTNANGIVSTVMPAEISTIMTSAAVITENVNPTLRTTIKADGSTSTTPKIKKPFSRPRVLTRLQEKINSLECDIQNLPQDSHLWRGNETHELLLPITTPADCKTNEDCSPMIISWEGQAEIQSGDVLLVEINDSLLTPADYNQTQNNVTHKAVTTVYQVTRLGHEHCDVTEGGLLDITPLVVDGKKIVTLYDKDLTEGINLLIVVSETWGSQCVRLKVTVKSDNCGENADCSGKGVCFSNASMEGYECQCCQGFAGPHCEEIDACLPSPCTNNGICVDLSQGHEGNAYQCLCPYGYTGKNCQYESDPCNPAECLNGGSCVGNSTHFRCDCAPGYTGPLCQHNLNECESSPCVHGICVDQEDGFRCFCQPGFAGELCNFEYNECESNPCMNGGQCIDQIGGYECKCTRGYTGNQCHIKVDFCANGPCPEGHRCIDRGDDFTCECPSGTNGPDCIQVPRTLCNVNPCSNGGTCWTSEDSFYCACRPGYTGKMCEDEFVVETVVSSSEFMIDDANARGSYSDKGFGVAVSKSPIELHNAYIAAGTLAAAIFIVAVVVTICHCKVNQTYRRFSTRHHQLIPIFGFGRRMKSPKSHRHWLSGKSGGGGGGGSGGGSVGGSTGNLVGIKSNKGHLPGTGTTQCHNHHIGSTPSYHHPHQIPDRPFQRHLAMNLENDMYYTVDFSDSQHSPLIK